MPILELENVSYEYSRGTPFQIGALKNVSVQFEKGEKVAVIGHTGSGKSTLLQCLNGLLKPQSGTVKLAGEDIHRSKAAVRDCRFRVGLCFQYPEQQLFESTIEKDIAFGPRNMGLSEQEVQARVREAIGFVGIPESYLGKSPFELSGGEKRRVAIAGVLSMEPEVLILDEPTAGLDPAGRKALLELIRSYHERTGSTVIFVSHSMGDTAEIADRILVMNAGAIALSGTPREVFARGEELVAMGLNVPEITEVFLHLKEAGVPVPTDVYTLSKAKRILSEIVQGRMKK